ncbi:hypothetical protein BDV93DRAFT_603245 [Ceratobasidium sp. AG-I]|nr:hypothetical protein BDV93DRAFT_603245 [Ceratobasidium sp. AG-I]
MAPSRRKDSEENGEAQSTNDKRRRYQKKSNPEEPGVQKTKASLRQTHRLLAKDNLAADVRIQTERRLKSLESDLAKAEIRKKERAMAVRYHKIKFFDKQKVTRKINQAKKALEAPELDKKERKKLQKALLGHRIDLNYILHYPKLDKYISLYPSTEAADPDNAAETDKLRTERRQLVREAMEKGEMDAEPEIRGKSGDAAAEDDDEGPDEPIDSDIQESDEDEGETKPAKASSKRKHSSSDKNKPKLEETEKIEKKKSKQKSTSLPQQQLVDVKEDDFFDT